VTPRAPSLALAALVLFLAAPRTPAAEELAEARHRFLSTRDVAALQAAFAGSAPREPDAVTDARLVGLASLPDAEVAATGGTGYAAVPDVVTALRRLDPTEAEGALTRVRQQARVFELDGWLGALLAARRGRDADAEQTLRSLGASPAPAEEAAFRLALVGAALPEDDRLLLAGTAREALLAAATDGDLAAAEGIGRRLAGLDPGFGAEAIGLAAFAWTRAGRPERGATLFEGAESRWVTPDASALLAHAAWAWRRGRRAEASRLVGDRDMPAGLAPIAQALVRGGGSPSSPVPDGPVHLPPDRRVPALVAELASDLGVATTPAEVDARAVALDRQSDELGFVKRFLEERGLAVRCSAGTDAGLAGALERGYAAFLLHLEAPRDGFEWTWRLVRARDAETGLWIAETANLGDPGLLAPNLPRESLMLLVAPAKDADGLDAVVSDAEKRLGTVLLDAISDADAGHLRAGANRIRSAYEGTPPYVAAVAAAWLLYQRYVETQPNSPANQDRVAIAECRDLLQPLLGAGGLCAFVPYGYGTATLLAPGTREPGKEAAAALDRARDLAPASAQVALAGSDAHIIAGDRDVAFRAIERARRLDPLDVRALFKRALMRDALGDTERARADLLRVFDRRPDWVRGAMALTLLELNAGLPREALAHLDRLVAAVPEVGQEEAVRHQRGRAEAMLLQRASSADEVEPLLASSLPQTRRLIAFALARWETNESEALMRRLLHDENEGVRGTALKVYMRPWLRARVEQDTALGRTIQDLLHTDESELVRGAAAGLLGLVEATWAGRELASALIGNRRDDSPYVRAEVANALTRHDGPLARKSLVAALDDPDADVRRAAIDALFRVAATYRGYDPDASAEARAEAVARWRAWAER
jgi:hypothetical protein